MRAVGAMLVNADNTSNSDCTDMEQLYLARNLSTLAVIGASPICGVCTGTKATYGRILCTALLALPNGIRRAMPCKLSCVHSGLRDRIGWREPNRNRWRYRRLTGNNEGEQLCLDPNFITTRWRRRSFLAIHIRGT